MRQLLKYTSIFKFLFFGNYAEAQFKWDSLLMNNTHLKKVYQNAEKYHLQLFYTHVDHNTSKAVCTDYSFTTNSYNYCASLIKLPIAVLALCKLNELGLNETLYLFTDSSETCHRSVRLDTSSENALPSIAHYIKKMLLISDNDAYNRCFEFLGVDYIHSKLKEWAYPDVRITNRYDLFCGGGQSKYTNPIQLVNDSGKIVFEQKALPIDEKWTKPLQQVQIGKGYINASNTYVSKPKNFSSMNFMTEADVHRFMKDLFYLRADKFGLSEEQFRFLEVYMSISPEKSTSPRYLSKNYPANYKKYLFFGNDEKSLNDTTFVSSNILGLSYGFITDCARFKSSKNGIEFILSAALYVNENEILNDGKYEYNQIGIPFLSELGKEVYKYEQSIQKK